MALTTTSMVANFSDTDQSTDYATNSWAPTTGAGWVLFVHGGRATTTPPDATATGNTIIWTSLASIGWATDTGTIKKAQMFKGVGASPTTGATTISFGGTAMVGAGWSIIEVAGGDPAVVVVAGSAVTNFNNTAGTTGTLTLNAAANANNRPIVYFAHGAQEATAPRTNWTELNDVTPTGPAAGLETQWRSDTFETSASATWTTSSKWGVVGGELAIAAAVVTQPNVNMARAIV